MSQPSGRAVRKMPKVAGRGMGEGEGIGEAGCCRPALPWRVVDM